MCGIWRGFSKTLKQKDAQRQERKIIKSVMVLMHFGKQIDTFFFFSSESSDRFSPTHVWILNNRQREDYSRRVRNSKFFIRKLILYRKFYIFFVFQLLNKNLSYNLVQADDILLILNYFLDSNASKKLINKKQHILNIFLAFEKRF